MKFEFQDVAVEVTPTNDQRQWYMTLEETAKAYGVTRRAVQQVLDRHPDEIREGVETDGTVCSSRSVTGVEQRRHINILYREGVIKLGFFMRSQRAKAFRQFATDLVMEHLDQQGLNSPHGFQQFMDAVDERFNRLENVCRGIRDEVDELRATLNLLINEDDEKTIRALIRRIKDKFNCDGRAVVGKVRGILNMASIYETPDTRKVINTLRNILGEGLMLVKEEEDT